MPKSPLQQLLDSGVEFTAMSRKQAESVVKQLVKAGEVRKKDADDAVQALLKRSRETSERIAEVLQREVGKQVDWMSERFDELEERLEELNRRLRSGGATGEAAPAGDDGTRVKKTAARKTAAKKTAARKTAAKKTAARKTAAKKTAAKKTAAATPPAPADPPAAAPAGPPAAADD